MRGAATGLEGIRDRRPMVGRPGRRLFGEFEPLATMRKLALNMTPITDGGKVTSTRENGRMPVGTMTFLGYARTC